MSECENHKRLSHCIAGYVSMQGHFNFCCGRTTGLDRVHVVNHMQARFKQNDEDSTELTSIPDKDLNLFGSDSLLVGGRLLFSPLFPPGAI